MPTVDQIDCGLVLRVAGSKPRRMVVEVELGEAGNNARDDLGGRRSSSQDKPEATGTARRGEWCVRLLGTW